MRNSDPQVLFFEIGVQAAYLTARVVRCWVISCLHDQFLEIYFVSMYQSMDILLHMVDCACWSGGWHLVSTDGSAQMGHDPSCTRCILHVPESWRHGLWTCPKYSRFGVLFASSSLVLAFVRDMSRGVQCPGFCYPLDLTFSMRGSLQIQLTYWGVGHTIGVTSV